MKAEIKDWLWVPSGHGGMMKVPSSYHFGVECKVSPTKSKPPASGYGNRIPTDFMIKYQGRWRRVYCCCYSNSGTLYIGEARNWIATVESIDGKE